MRFLLRPGWLALTAAVVAFAAACVYLLAPWQFHRSTERDAANSALQNAQTGPPVPRARLVAPGAAPTADQAWRQVSVVGVYRPEGEVLVRLRSVDGGAAVEVLTPVSTADGQTVLVDRGYVRPLSGRALPPIAAPPSGPVTVAGYLHLDEGPADRPAIVENGRPQVYSASADAVAAATGVRAESGYVQLLPAQPGVLTPVPLPPFDLNTSYSYAWQWLAFAVMALAGWCYVVRLEYLTRRQEGPAGSTPTGPPERTTTDMLADRYGGRR